MRLHRVGRVATWPLPSFWRRSPPQPPSGLQRVRVAQLEAELARVERLCASGNASPAEIDKARSDVAAARRAPRPEVGAHGRVGRPAALGGAPRHYSP